MMILGLVVAVFVAIAGMTFGLKQVEMYFERRDCGDQSAYRHLIASAVFMLCMLAAVNCIIQLLGAA